MRRLEQAIEPVQELAQDDVEIERGIEKAGGTEKDAKVWPAGILHGAVSASLIRVWVAPLKAKCRARSRCVRRGVPRPGEGTAPISEPLGLTQRLPSPHNPPAGLPPHTE